jgi:anthranilate/para-aminobenzoate synthase component I
MSYAERRLTRSGPELWSRLARLPGAFRLRDEGRLFVGALPVERSSLVDPDRDAPGPSAPELHDWPKWVGVLPYECFRHLERDSSKRSQDARRVPHLSSIIWNRYDAIAQVDSHGLLVRGTSEEAVRDLCSALLSDLHEQQSAQASLKWIGTAEDPELHRRRVRVALDRIARGLLYQVNLARRFEFAVEGHALSLLHSLGSLADAPFSAALDLGEVQVVSTSPELFLDYRSDGRVMTRPIKGTRPRSADPGDDARNRAELEESEKERAELAMVIDIERNDLGRLALPGTVTMSAPPAVVSYPTVHHREATVSACLAPSYSRADLFHAMMPSGSVTGAPKVAAMELICELEAHRRGLYTGALGYLTHGGGARLSMAIRVLTLRGGTAHYFAGGGIVADSDPEQELQETAWKAEQLRALVTVR